MKRYIFIYVCIIMLLTGCGMQGLGNEASKAENDTALENGNEKKDEGLRLSDYSVEEVSGMYELKELIPEISGMKLINCGFRDDNEILLLYKSNDEDDKQDEAASEDSFDANVERSVNTSEDSVDGKAGDKYIAKLLNIDSGDITDMPWEINVPYDEYGTSRWLQVVSLKPLILFDQSECSIYTPENGSIQADASVPSGSTYQLANSDMADMICVDNVLYLVRNEGIIERVNSDGTLETVYAAPVTVGETFLYKSEAEGIIRLGTTSYKGDYIYIDVDTDTWEGRSYIQEDRDFYVNGVSGHLMYSVGNADSINTAGKGERYSSGEKVTVDVDDEGQMDGGFDLDGEGQMDGESDLENGDVISKEDAYEYPLDENYEYVEVSDLIVIDTDNQTMRSIGIPEELTKEAYLDISSDAMSGDMLLAGIYDYSGDIKDILLWDISTAKETEIVLNEKKPYAMEESDYGEISERADELGREYGVEIRFGENIRPEISDYTFAVCHNTDYINGALDMLDKVLGYYPKGFFGALEQGCSRETMIYLTGQQKPKDTSVSISNSAGLSSDEDGLNMLFLDIDDGVLYEGTIVHEIAHLIDRKLWMDDVLDEEEWNRLNPAGFEYHNEYVSESGEDYSMMDDYEYTAYYDNAWEEDYRDTYFVDSYSKTWPTEDRARLMEYLMGSLDYDEDMFHSMHLRDKLWQYFEIIRDDLGNTSWPKETVWEKRLADYEPY